MNRKQPKAYLSLAIFRALTVFLSFLVLGTSVFAQELYWAKRAGGTDYERCTGISTGYERCSGIAVDGSGNSYVTGNFQGTCNL